MAEASKVRLVRCPKCENLLPELPDFSIYQCGGCGAVLKAKEKGVPGDELTELPDAENGFGISEKNSLVNESEAEMGSTEVNDGSTMKETTVHGEREGLNNGITSRTENREVLADLDRKQKRRERLRQMEHSDSEYWPSLEGLIDDGNQEKYRGRNTNRSPIVNFNSECELENIRHPVSRLRHEKWDMERNGSVLSHEDVGGYARHGRFYNFPDEGPSNYDMGAAYGYGERKRYNGDNLGGLAKVEDLENDRAELLRKLDELKDKLSRSCDVKETQLERIGFNNKIPSAPHRHHALYATEGLVGSYGTKRQAIASDDKPPHLSRNPGHMPFVHRYGSDFPDPRHQRNFPQELLGNGDVYHPQNLGRSLGQMPYEYFPRRYHDEYPGTYMDINQDLFMSRPHGTFFHQPACSCVHCFNKNWHNPPRTRPTNLHGRWSPDDPFVTNFHCTNPAPAGLQGYGSEGYSAVSQYSLDHQPLRMSSSNQEVDHGDLNHRRPRKVVLAQGTGRLCRPIAGGAPFIACCNCFELLKLPSNHITMAGTQQKMKCGACSSTFLFELGNKGIVVSAPAQVDQLPAQDEYGSSGGLDGNGVYLHGDSDAAAVDPCSNTYDESEPKFSIKDENSNSSKFEKRDPPSCRSSFSVDEQSPDSVIVRKDDRHLSAELPAKKVGGDNHCSVNALVSGYDKGNKSNRSDRENVGLDKITSRQNSVRDVAVATDTDISLTEFTNSCVSQDSVEVSKEERPRTNKGSESFIAGFFKRSFRDFSKSDKNLEGERSDVFVNGHFIPQRLVKKAEKLAGPIQPGDYWYDYRAGFWGVMGHPCLGIIMPNIEEFNYPMPENCAAGNTDVFVNGRELHQKDLDLLASRGLPITRHKSYLIDISGEVVDEQTGEELDNLGKLAPTVERTKHGFGMKVPRFIAELRC